MKRGRKPLNGNGSSESDAQETLVKSSYMLESVLKQNLAYYALAEGIDQSDVVRQALADFLRKKKLDPTRPPRFFELA